MNVSKVNKLKHIQVITLLQQIIGSAIRKFLGFQICCPRPTFYKQWPISHNIGSGDKQKSRVLYLHYAQLLITTINEVQL